MLLQKTSPLIFKALHLYPPFHYRYPWPWDHLPEWLRFIILKFRLITIYCNYDYLTLLFILQQFFYLNNTSDFTIIPPNLRDDTCFYFLQLSLDPRAITFFIGLPLPSSILPYSHSQMLWNPSYQSQGCWEQLEKKSHNHLSDECVYWFMGDYFNWSFGYHPFLYQEVPLFSRGVLANFFFL